MRSLLAWFTQQEGISALLGHPPAVGEDTTAQQQSWEAARDALQRRAEYNEPTPTLDLIPPELQAQAEAFRQRPDVAASFAGLDWTVGMADLNRVLSFQKLVAQEHSIERANQVVSDDPRGLFSFCLPEPATEINLVGGIDQDQKAVTLSSLNPNLRIAGHLILDIDVAQAPGQPARKQKFVGFAINYGAPFVQIAEYNGRWFVRDGYHRCYGLLRRGIHRVPCVFVRAASFEQLVGDPQGFFPYEIIFGNRPPLLRDFLDDAVSITGTRMATRKVVRISAEDFVVMVE